MGLSWVSVVLNFNVHFFAVSGNESGHFHCAWRYSFLFFFSFLSLGCIILWWLMLVLCEIVPVTELCSGLLVQGLLVTLIEWMGRGLVCVYCVLLIFWVHTGGWVWPKFFSNFICFVLLVINLKLEAIKELLGPFCCCGAFHPKGFNVV